MIGLDSTAATVAFGQLGPSLQAIALQVVTPSDGPIQFGLALGSAVLGLAIGAVALRGYRRHESLPMLFVATGFLLAFWAPPALLFVYLTTDAFATFAPGIEASVVTAIGLGGEVTRIIGLLCILYGLAMPIRSPADGK